MECMRDEWNGLSLFLSGEGCLFYAQQVCVDGNKESALAPPILLLEPDNSEVEEGPSFHSS